MGGNLWFIGHDVQACHLIQCEGKNYEKRLCEAIQSGNYQETSSPLELWAGAIKQIAQHAEDSRIHTGFPKLAAQLFQEAMDAGYGREEVSALFKVLQNSSC